MGALNIGDIVARKSYGYDIFFKVVDIKNTGRENIYTLKGISYRIQADSPESDLVLQQSENVDQYRNKVRKFVERKTRDIYASYASRQIGQIKKPYYRDTPKDNARKFSRPGKVLHLDGDNDYLETCLTEYKKFGIETVGKFIPEREQPIMVYRLLQDIRPDILVLTGHDGVNKKDGNYLNPSNYVNSRYFIDAVKEARRYDPDLDGLVIFAGACQSMFSDIIKAGANYASAPFRVLIHALDPVLICQKIAYASFDRVLSPSEVIGNTITGNEGIGGLQVRGKYRDGFPQEPYGK